MPQAVVSSPNSEREIRLEYEITDAANGDPNAPTLLLIMGLGCQLVHWPDAFRQALAERGFRVIAYDNRDIGLSTWLDDLKPLPRGKMDLARWALGQRLPAHYSLDDMAADAVGLLDALGIEQAHAVGCSMGGMITQLLAIHHRQRLLSMTSIMSSTGNRRVGWPRPGANPALRGRPASNAPEDLIDFGVVTWTGLQGRGYQTPEPELRPKIARVVDRAIHPAGFMRHLQAIMNAGNRESALRKLDLPALVIHGDDDPLIHVSGARATARAIPGADLEIIRGWGHDFPDALHSRLADRITEHAGGAVAAAA